MLFLFFGNVPVFPEGFNPVNLWSQVGILHASTGVEIAKKKDS